MEMQQNSKKMDLCFFYSQEHFNVTVSQDDVLDKTIHCPKRKVNFVTDNYRRWAPDINSENLRYWKQAIAISN
jgi:hypothetical protein